MTKETAWQQAHLTHIHARMYKIVMMFGPRSEWTQERIDLVTRRIRMKRETGKWR